MYAVVSADLVEFDQSGRNWVFLPPTTRELRKMSGAAWPEGFRDSMHLLNVEAERLTILRGFRLVEQPKCFQFGRRQDSTLRDVDLKRDSGEIFHPGEDGEMQRRREEMRRKTEHGSRHESGRPSFASGPRISAPQGLWKAKASDTLAWPRRSSVPCEVCGKLTPEEDQIVYTPRG